MAENICRGDLCIDATAGRGRDTLFLSRLVGDEGQVHAFDVQSEAIESTRRLLEENRRTNCLLHLFCHSRMSEFVQSETAAGIMFNFGWLPGGDHRKFSTSLTSIPAIKNGLNLLKPKGVMTLCLYHGKETGYEEKDAVLAYVKTLDPRKYSVLFTDFINRIGDVPIAVLIQKETT